MYVNVCLYTSASAFFCATKERLRVIPRQKKSGGPVDAGNSSVGQLIRKIPNLLRYIGPENSISRPTGAMTRGAGSSAGVARGGGAIVTAKNSTEDSAHDAARTTARTESRITQRH